MIFEEETIFDDSNNEISCFKCNKDLEKSLDYKNYKICPYCNFHFHMSARERIASIVDKGTFTEIFNKITTSYDEIAQEEIESYDEKIKTDQDRTGLNEAVLCGTSKIGSQEAIIIALDFGFLGGSMGLIVGEKIALSIEMATKKKLPVVTLINSGGSRIQEGVMSLMQMSKTVAAVNNLKNANQPLISILSNPSTGQVMASFVALSDIIIAEPGAHIGYSPYRKLKELTGSIESNNYLSEDFLNSGFIDNIAPRNEIKFELTTLLSVLKPTFALKKKKADKISSQIDYKEINASNSLQLSRKIKRPKSIDYISRIFNEFIELNGDRSGGNDTSVKIGLGKISGEPVILIAQHREVLTRVSSNNVSRNYNNKIVPSGFRKASRALDMAQKFNIPCLCIIDSVSPELSLKSEYDGLAFSISELISKKLNSENPIISVIIGEGGSETALAFSIADSVMMLKNSIFTPLSPEEAAKIKTGDKRKANEILKTMRLTSADCLEMGIIDKIIDEPEGGAHRNHDESARLLEESILEEIISIRDIFPKTLSRRRLKKFRQMGEYSQKYKPALTEEMKIWRTALTAGVSSLRSGSKLKDK